MGGGLRQPGGGAGIGGILTALQAALGQSGGAGQQRGLAKQAAIPDLEKPPGGGVGGALGDRAATELTTGPLAASTLSAVVQLLPSVLVLMAKSSEPAVPSSTRPDQPVWNSRLAVSPAADLLILS